MTKEFDVEYFQIIVSKHLRSMFIELEYCDFFEEFDNINIIVDGKKQEIDISFIKKHEEK